MCMYYTRIIDQNKVNHDDSTHTHTHMLAYKTSLKIQHKHAHIDRHSHTSKQTRKFDLWEGSCLDRYELVPWLVHTSGHMAKVWGMKEIPEHD